MSKSEKQKLKLLYIKRFLEKKTDKNHGVTVREIIEYLDKNGISAERKSIYSDLESLEDYGMIIDRTKEGRETLYRLGEKEFELSELKLLSDAAGAFKFINPRDLRTLLNKVTHLASDYEAQRLNRQVNVTNRGKDISKNVLNSIDFIHEAINCNSSITFKYIDWNASKKKEYRHNGALYRVSPWALIFDDEKYYLMGYDHNSKEIRNYRIDRMDSISIAEEKRQGRRAFEKIDMAEYTSVVFSMYSGRTETVVLSFDNSLANVVIDRFGKDVSFIKKDDSHFTVSIKASVSNQFFGWLAGLGNGVEILSPQSVRQRYKKHLENILVSYR
ncbi:MAG: WYL domain-containing protein [Oscillospiraceae bacterium]|nr:WYL domain-containing protein [Oscillospiraceae bacterium]